MQVAIGFRCSPKGLAYVVLEGCQERASCVAKDRLAFPNGMSSCEKLTWLRKQICELLHEHSVTRAGIKAIEPFAKKKSLERARAEGVVMEAVHSVLGCECTPRIKVQLKKAISGFTEPARYLERVLSRHQIASLSGPEMVEAALAAIAELPQVADA